MAEDKQQDSSKAGGQGDPEAAPPLAPVGTGAMAADPGFDPNVPVRSSAPPVEALHGIPEIPENRELLEERLAEADES